MSIILFVNPIWTTNLIFTRMKRTILELGAHYIVFGIYKFTSIDIFLKKMLQITLFKNKKKVEFSVWHSLISPYWQSLLTL